MTFLKRSTRQLGTSAEDLACKYIRSLGFKILDRNYLIRGGEIDIVAKDDNELVFVEVKARYSHEYGLPQESITPWKIKSLKKTALFYLQKINWGNKPYRFDLVGIDFTYSENKPKVELIKNIIWG